MKLLLLHGWGFDASLWDAMRALLPEFETMAWDRGYFGPATCELPEGEFLAVGHSLGSLLLAIDPLPGCVGLVAVNGFDRFVGPDRVPSRVVARMRERFAMRPAEVLRDFRVRCGVDGAPDILDHARLSKDLELLADGNAAAALTATVAVLHGAEDPLLPAAMRDTVFPGAPRTTCPGGGHLLPLTHPHWCAGQIREVMACA